MMAAADPIKPEAKAFREGNGFGESDIVTSF